VSTTIFTGCEKKEETKVEEKQLSEEEQEALEEKCLQEVKTSYDRWGDFRDASRKCVEVDAERREIINRAYIDKYGH
ncbi:MAG: hypothetical protein LBG67_05450, partial [Campylobacteraceae bacterium]|nr:hypothetical protein [Campylobacteraceae bacterium]